MAGAGGVVVDPASSVQGLMKEVMVLRVVNSGVLSLCRGI